MDDQQDEDVFNRGRNFDGPAPYNFEPVRQPREASASAASVIPRYQQEMEAWCQNNLWRLGQRSWCLCGECQPMAKVIDNMCCRESEPFWKLVDDLVPRPENITCLTQHPGFEGCCLNPFVLKIAYLAFRQEHGPLTCHTYKQYRYTAYRQVVRWVYGFLGKHNRRVVPACVKNAIRQKFPEIGGTYKGFLWPDLG